MLLDIFDPVKRNLKKYWEIVNVVNSFEDKINKLSDRELQAKTAEFKERLSKGEDGQSILPEAFAVVREVAKRTVNMRPFDVQILGAFVLYNGDIAEMKTGEGKTLVATMPLYLNALQGHGGHLVTVNDYLAKRDSEWMGPIYAFLGLTAGLIQHDSTYEDRKKAYNSDVTYGTNNEFGFDYLRDHMALSEEQRVQRELYYAIVDEADNILIDEARTPLIISGPSEESTSKYYTAKKVLDNLIEGVDIVDIDEKLKTFSLSEKGMDKIEKMLHNNLYGKNSTEEEIVAEGEIINVDDVENMRKQNDEKEKLKSAIHQAIKAKLFFKREVDYIVKDGEVIIVDEFTGRLMFGRRYSDGLHQAIEAKEGLAVKSESQTLATITFQNYFRLYKKLAGMTGTALTERDELREIYNLEVYAIPTNVPMIRKDALDIVFKTESAKFRAIVKKIKELYERGEPVLVGTRSVEKSERISAMLKKENIPHNVLNAKYHEKEAMIIKDAGQNKMVTIATNMAGRGVDIKLGNGITNLGGLFILGTERHEARRIDNQLRGRSGRQGDPGESQFYISLEDELMRIFGGDTIKRILTTLKIDENEPIEHPLLSRAMEGAQKKVEALNFSARKNLLDYDNVLEKQREVIYTERDKIFRQDSVKDDITGMLKDVVEKTFLAHYSENAETEGPGLIELENALSQIFNRKIKFDIKSIENASKEQILNDVLENSIKTYEEKEHYIGEELMRKVEKYVLLRMIDSNWKDHLYTMDDLKEGIGFRAYGQQDPLMAYQKEGHDYFDNMMARIEEDTIKTILRIEIQKEESQKEETQQSKEEEKSKVESNQENSISKEERQKRRQLEKKLKKKRKL